MDLSTLPTQTLVAVAFVATALMAVALAWWRQPARRNRRMLRSALRAIGREALCDVVVPDGLGGQIHIDYLLLTAQGLLVLEVKDVKGTIFASDNLDHWKVIDSDRRYQIRNPQPGLAARVAAIRQLVQDVPITGRIAFLPYAKPAHGNLPSDSRMLKDLIAEFGLAREPGNRKRVEAFHRAWDQVRASSVPG